MSQDAPEIADSCHPEVADGKMRLRTLDDLDGRTRAAIRARQLMESLESDLGGAHRLSTAERALAQRAALIATLCEHQEAAYLLGQQVDFGIYLAATNSLRRLLVALGLKSAGGTDVLGMLLKQPERPERGPTAEELRAKIAERGLPVVAFDPPLPPTHIPEREESPRGESDPDREQFAEAAPSPGRSRGHIESATFIGQTYLEMHPRPHRTTRRRT